MEIGSIVRVFVVTSAAVACLASAGSPGAKMLSEAKKTQMVNTGEPVQDGYAAFVLGAKQLDCNVGDVSSLPDTRIVCPDNVFTFVDKQTTLVVVCGQSDDAICESLIDRILAAGKGALSS